MPLLDRLRNALGRPVDTDVPQGVPGLAGTGGGAGARADQARRLAVLAVEVDRLAQRSTAAADAMRQRTGPGGRDAARVTALASPAAAWAGAGPREVASAKAVADPSDG